MTAVLQVPRKVGIEPPSRVWGSVRLGDLGRWFGGGTPSKANPLFWKDGDIPWVSPKDMKTARIYDAEDHITREAVENSATSLVRKGSILVVVRSGILKHTLPVAITERQITINQDLKAFAPSAEISSEFLALALKAFEKEILHTCCKSGTTVQNLDMPAFLRFQIPRPPLDDQKQIVAEIEKQFTRLEAGVSSLKRVQANLKRYRAAVLKAACEGAANVPISEVCEVVSGYAFKSSDFCEEGIPVVKIANVSYGSYLDDAPSFLPNKFLAEFQRFQIRQGDILLALTRPITNNQVKTCLYPSELPNALLNQRVAKLAPTNRILRGYLLAYLRSEHFKSAISVVMPQTLQPNLSPRDLAALPIPLPPLVEQKRIVEEVERRLSVIEELEAAVSANLQRATRLRQSILQKAFTGD